MASRRDSRRNVGTGRLLGTRHYVAPEQLRRNRLGADPRSDVYQVGLILYELLTLSAAFDPEDVAVFEHIHMGVFKAPRKVSAAVPRPLEDICLRALETDPVRRYSSAAEFRTDLRRWLQGFQPECGMRLEELVTRRTREGEPLVIFGPLAVTTELPVCTPDEVKAKVRHAIEVCRGQASMVLFTSNTINPDVPLANIVAMHEAVRS